MNKDNIHVIITSVIGTFLEWAEYSFYGYLATKISHLFFPQFDSRTALLAAFGVFAAGFIARPLGGVIFGHIGDRIGRRTALSSAIVLMGFSTLCIGLLPTYDQIGILAPILLLLCRITQGLAVSGEFNGAAVFLIEHSPINNRYLAGSWVGSAAAAGMLTGALIVALISLPMMPAWAWRIPFLLGSASCIVGFYVRRSVAESPDFVREQQENNHKTLPLVETFRSQKSAMLQTIACAAFVGIYVYVCNIYFASFLIHEAHFTMGSAILIAGLGQLLVAILIPMMAYIADVIGGKSLMLLGLIGATTVAPMVFLLGLKQSMFLAFAAQMLYAGFNAVVCAPMFKYIVELFPTRTRYTGTTLAWSLSVAFFGGTAPIISEYCVGTLHFIEGPAILVMASSMVAFLTILFCVEDKDPLKIEPSFPPSAI